MNQRELPGESKTPFPPAHSARLLSSIHDFVVSHMPAPGAGSPEQANKWVVLLLSGTGAFMTTLDGSIVNISLPAIANSFGVPLSGTVEWVIIGYLVVIAGVLLTFGRLADMIGRKPIWLAGLVVFTLGSAISGAAPSLGVLIGARIFQGLGAALIFSVNIAMITGSFPPQERGRALGVNGIVVALGISVGPTVGGIITQYLTWHWIFYINVPIGILLFIVSQRLLTERMHRGQGRFDPAGATLLGIGLAAVTLGLSFGQEWGWTSARLLISLLVGVLALVAAVLVESRVQDPVLDLNLLRNRVFASALVSFIMAMLALFAPGFLLPFYFEELRGFSALEAGLLLTPLSLVLAILAPISGSLADRIGSRWLSPIGLTIACIGLVLLSQLNETSSIWDIAWRLAVIGVGQGIFQAPNTRAMMSPVPRPKLGEASGLLATGRVIGQSLSVAIAGAVFAGLGGAAAGSMLTMLRQSHISSSAQIDALQNTFVNSLHAALLVCAAFAAIGILTSLVRGNERAKAS
jgi:EmrB/QacA subfamily drug resistance transporter